MSAFRRGGQESRGGAGLPSTIRLLSYNIQMGVDTTSYRDYFTQGWKHLLPHRARMRNLNRIAALLHGFDMVSLQEVDAGSLRSGFVDITEYLAHRAAFPHWYRQINRNIGPIARHSNGFLSRFPAAEVSHYKLPAAPGRGAMVIRFGSHRQAFTLCCAHLALGRRGRERQLAFLSEVLADYPHLVVMGDLNADCRAPEIRRFIIRTGLHEPACDQPTFPSWRPVRKIDHILVSESLTTVESKVLDYSFSDHLPVQLTLALPESARAGEPRPTVAADRAVENAV